MSMQVNAERSPIEHVEQDLPDAESLLGCSYRNDPQGLGRIPAESDDGNVEYKLRLVGVSKDRFEHLRTQMHYRLAEGQGEAIYELGVEDDGTLRGLGEEEMEETVQTVEDLADAQGSDAVLLRKRRGIDGVVAEVLVRRRPADDCPEIRIAVAGNVDSGKSTLVGVLTRGQLDNGRGLARMNVFKHKHEITTGRTSDVSHQIMGFNSKGEIVNHMGPHAHSSWSEIVEDSSKVIKFIDLGGHERYLKTTVFGLTGLLPDYVMLAVGANMGVVGMTKEHMGISIALRLPLFIIVTKVDLSPEPVLQQTLQSLRKLLKLPSVRKIPYLINDMDDVYTCAKNIVSDRLAPIFLVSSVTGRNYELLKMFLNLLPATKGWTEARDKEVEFYLDETFNVPGIGTVVAGTLVAGSVTPNQTLMLGPDSAGNFIPITVKSIHSKRLPIKQVQAGQSATFSIKVRNEKIKRSQLRKGMVLVDPKLSPRATWEFEAEILVLYHHTTIQVNYQPVIHCVTIRQTARIIAMDRGVLRTRDKALVRFRFMYRPEHLKEGRRIIFREGKTKGIGHISRVIFPEQSGALEIDPKALTVLDKVGQAALQVGRSSGQGSGVGKLKTGKAKALRKRVRNEFQLQESLEKADEESPGLLAKGPSEPLDKRLLHSHQRHRLA